MNEYVRLKSIIDSRLQSKIVRPIFKSTNLLELDVEEVDEVLLEYFNFDASSLFIEPFGCWNDVMRCDEESFNPESIFISLISLAIWLCFPPYSEMYGFSEFDYKYI